MEGSYFSLAQWQELELQALIFRYMLAGAAVPVELLNPIKKSLSSLLNTAQAQYLVQHQHQQHALQPYYPFYQPAALFQAGYWGRAAMDPEPGRCRRTDGKKWRCSRDVVVSQKYCERHMHRGRHRSRKPVETTPNPSLPPTSSASHFALSSSASNSVDLLRLGRSLSDVKCENKPNVDLSGESKSDGHVLRHFFDDWPRSHQEPGSNASCRSSTTSLSISMPGNSSSDVALKLGTGDVDGPGQGAAHPNHLERPLGWAPGWGSSPMGGPLAEALRSSNSDSPTSVLHQLPRSSASETCIVGS